MGGRPPGGGKNDPQKSLVRGFSDVRRTNGQTIKGGVEGLAGTRRNMGLKRAQKK